MVTELNSASKGLGSKPGWSQCVVFVGTLLYSTPPTRVAVKRPCSPNKFAWGLNTGILFRRSSNVLTHKRKKSVEVATVNSH